MVINTPVRQLRPAHRRLRDPLGRGGDEHPVRHHGAGRFGGGAGHRGGHPRRHRRDVAARAAQRAGAAERWRGFGRRLADAVSRRGPLCPGIDPHPELLRGVGPVGRRRRAAQVLRHLRRGVRRLRRGQAAGGVLRGLRRRRLSRCWSAPSPRCAASGVLVLADAKRGDIGSTMAAYAARMGRRLTAGRRRRHRLALSRIRFAAAAARHAPPPTAAGCSCWPPRPTPRAPACSGPRPTDGRWRSRSSTPRRPSTATRRPSRVRSAWSSARRCRRRPTSARWAVRSWCPASARRADGPMRCAASAAPAPGSCCPRCRARCCGPDPTSRRCGPRPSRFRDAVAYLA